MAQPGRQMDTPEAIINFWRQAGPDRWFAKNDAFDAEIRQQFMAVWENAGSGKLSGWQKTDKGLLALVLVLDQFPSNMFRNDPRAFSSDAQARKIARRALETGADMRTERALRGFFYLPFEHCEQADDQALSIALFLRLGEKEMLHYAELHADIIRRFGRFPHRNAILGRQNTPQEQAFLDEGGFAG